MSRDTNTRPDVLYEKHIIEPNTVVQSNSYVKLDPNQEKDKSKAELRLTPSDPIVDFEKHKNRSKLIKNLKKLPNGPRKHETANVSLRYNLVCRCHSF